MMVGRSTVSCTLCRKRKLRCNRETPCSNCIRSRNGICVYGKAPAPSAAHSATQSSAESPQRPADQRQEPEEHHNPGNDQDLNAVRPLSVPSHASRSLLAGSSSDSSLAGQPIPQDVETIKSKIRQLEEQLSIATQSTAQTPAPTLNSDIQTSTTQFGGTFHFHNEPHIFGQPRVLARSVMHKTRLFGQSHWVNGITLLLEMMEMMEPHVQETSKVIYGIQRCKTLAKVIKSQWAPPWPTPPATDLPLKALADELVDCYLRTTETVYRILHIPTFRKDYEALWLSDTPPNTAFMVQLKLVLAIGATVYDEQFSLRTSAIRWVYEAQTWLSDPEFKSRLHIQTLQTNLLLLLARETAGISGELIWISAGALLRTAMSLGLHRDPARLPKKTILVAEMHRRLWNTVLEITLQSSITSGGPPLISLEDFDTNPPGNFDDEQLMAEDPVPKRNNNFTQISIAIALRNTFSLRLTIAKFLNNLNSQGLYDETLRLDTELRTAYKALCQTLQEYTSSTGPTPSRFEIRVVDFIMHRYLSSIHIPFFRLSLYEAAYAFSRKVVVETSLKIWYSAYPPASVMSASFSSEMPSSGSDDLARLVVFGSGFFRTVAFQATLLIVVELKTQLQEEESLGPVPLRPDLVSVLQDAKTWCLKSIEAGETNIKGYLLMCVAAAQIKGLMQGLKNGKVAELLLKAAEDAEEKCLPLLEEMAAKGRGGDTVDGLERMSLNMPSAMMEDWDFLMSDSQFDFSDVEPMGWELNAENVQELSLW